MVGALVGAVSIVSDPRVKRWWSDAVAPGAKKMWCRITTKESGGRDKKRESIQEKPGEATESDTSSLTEVAIEPEKPTIEADSADE